MNQKSKAYKLSSPKDNKDFYNDCASRYDTDFYDDIEIQESQEPEKPPMYNSTNPRVNFYTSDPTRN